jgi:hypothetical protein
MNMKILLITCAVSIVAAVITTVLLKMFGVEETAVIAGGVSGGIGAVVATQLAAKKKDDT